MIAVAIKRNRVYFAETGSQFCSDFKSTRDNLNINSLYASNFVEGESKLIDHVENYILIIYKIGE